MRAKRASLHFPNSYHRLRRRIHDVSRNCLLPPQKPHWISCTLIYASGFFDSLFIDLNVSFTFKHHQGRRKGMRDQKETWSHIKDIVFGGLFLVSELEQIRRHTHYKISQSGLETHANWEFYRGQQDRFTEPELPWFWWVCHILKKVSVGRTS